jgi:hypothetical protein
MRRLLLPALLAAVVLAGVGCNEYNDSRGRGDAPIGEVNEEPRTIFEMPDKYGNVATFCDGPNQVYVMTADVPPVVVTDSANCGGTEVG